MWFNETAISAATNVFVNVKNKYLNNIISHGNPQRSYGLWNLIQSKKENENNYSPSFRIKSKSHAGNTEVFCHLIMRCSYSNLGRDFRQIKQTLCILSLLSLVRFLFKFWSGTSIRRTIPSNLHTFDEESCQAAAAGS